MKTVRRDLRVMGLSLGLILAGALLVWRGFNTPPGQPALEIPRREDWSATEAKLAGVLFVVIGSYGVARFSRSK